MKIRGYHRYKIRQEKHMKVIDYKIIEMVKDSLKYQSYYIKKFWEKLK